MRSTVEHFSVDNSQLNLIALEDKSSSHVAIWVVPTCDNLLVVNHIYSEFRSFFEMMSFVIL